MLAAASSLLTWFMVELELEAAAGVANGLELGEMELADEGMLECCGVCQDHILDLRQKSLINISAFFNRFTARQEIVSSLIRERTSVGRQSWQQCSVSKSFPLWGCP